MLEHPAMSMQSIAKWFEEGCSQTDNTGAGTGTGIGNNNSNNNSTSNLSTSFQSSEESTNAATATDTTATITNNSFPILECTDIYLLSQLLGVKSETLLERATRQLAAIEELPLRKDRLLAISGELTLLSPESGGGIGGGHHHHRRPVALRLLTEQIDGRSPLFARFPDQLYFHRALVRLKDRQLTEALTDLYLGLNLHENMDNSFSSGGLKHTADVEQQRSLDPIHVLILKEIKKYLTSSSESDCSTQIILVPDIGPVSFDQVLKQYDQYVSQFIRRQLFNAADDDDDYSLTQGEQTEAQGDELELFKKWWPTIEQENQSDILPDQQQQQQQKFLSTLSEKPPSPPSVSCSTPKPTYKSMLMGENKQAHLETEEAKDENEDVDDDNEEEKADQNSNQNKSHNSSTNNSSASLQSNTTEGKEQKWKEFNKPPKVSEVSYTVEVPHHHHHHHSLKKTITVQLAGMKGGEGNGKGNDNKANHSRHSPPLLDNLFNMRALLVGNLAPGAQLSSISQLFAAFGTVLNVQFVKAVSSNTQKVIRQAALVEFDNSHSPRLAISALSEVSLPYISEQWHLTFRFARGDGQRRMRICKENQVRSSRECYFWRTTGCRFAEGGRSGNGGGGGSGHCKFYHHRLAKGVDYQDWMIGCVSSEATGATGDGD